MPSENRSTGTLRGGTPLEDFGEPIPEAKTIGPNDGMLLSLHRLDWDRSGLDPTYVGGRYEKDHIAGFRRALARGSHVSGSCPEVCTLLLTVRVAQGDSTASTKRLAMEGPLLSSFFR